MEGRGIYTKEKLTKERILETVVYRMANRDANKEMLEEVPHIQLLDLAALYYCPVSLGNACTMGLLVCSEVCRHYGIQDRELDEAARRNTEAMGFSARRISEMLGIQEDCFPEIYVLINRESLFGASVILYPDYLRKLAERMGTDLYVLPSSIHEVIAVTTSGMEPSDLQDLVKTVNGTGWAVRPNEVLSNNVYRYSRDGGLVRVTDDGKKR